MPKHEKKGLMIRFEKEPGTWGEWIIMPTGGGGGGRDDKLTDRQAELVALAEFYKTRGANANKFVKTDGTNLVWADGDGVGTVTSITAGTGLSGGTITTSGTIAIDSTVTTNSGTQTLTNKRVTPRTASNGATTSGNITPTGDTADQYNISGLTGTSAIQIPSGTPTDAQKLSIRIEDNGTGRTLSWVTTAGGYRVIGTTLPLTTTANKTIYVGCVYNSADSFWDVVAVASEV
jgi:hypothetical protein